MKASHQMKFSHLPRPLLIGCLVAAGLSGCSRDADNTNQMANDLAMNNVEVVTPDETVPVTTTGQPLTGRSFADAMAASDAFEIQSAKLAATKAQDAKVKDFAAMMAKAHTESTAKLKAAAQTAKLAAPSPLLAPEVQARLDDLGKLTGAAFDKQYMAEQVTAHQSALDMLNGYGASGDVPEYKALAQSLAPVVADHLERARAIAR